MSEQPNNGTLRLYWYPSLPAKDDPFYITVNSAQEAVQLADALAAYDGYLYTQELRKDYENTGGLEVFKGDEWGEWKSSDGMEFSEYWSEYDKISREHNGEAGHKDIRFQIEGNEILKMEEDGTIYVNGKLAEKDKQVVDGLRQFLKASGVLVEED